LQEALRHGGDPELIAWYQAVLAGGAPPPAMPRAYVQGLFDDYADQFEQHLVHGLGYRGHEVLVDVLQQTFGTRRFARALDLGCGTGLCGVQLRRVADRIDGVDLSAPMLERARETGVYDQLEQADLVQLLQTTERRYDLIAAADVFTYLGDLAAVFAAAPRVLQPDGAWCFAVEAADDDVDFTLRPTMRYAHSRRYLHELASRHGFVVQHEARTALRRDRLQPIAGLYLCLTR
jgi:predicted TPR repeat methyltransferase